MFLPIGDTPNPRGFVPIVNWALIAANVLIYLVFTLPLASRPVDPTDPLLHQYLDVIARSLPRWVSLREVLASLSAYDLFVFAHGYKPGAPEISDLFSSMFLHGGFLHLAGNMLFLWIHGDNVEHRLGWMGYLLAYLGTGVAATLTFSVFAADSVTPLVGASGAISGVLGLYFLLFPRNKIKVLILLFPFFFDVLLLPVRWVLGFYVLVDNLLPFLLVSETGVAYGAHLGGFFAGLGLAAVGERYAWRWPFSNKRRSIGRKRRPTQEQDALARLRDAVGKGDQAKALEQVSRLTKDQVAQVQPEECVLLSDWLHQAGHPIAASNLLRRCVASNPDSQDMARVYLALGLLRLKQGQATAAYQHLLNVFDFEPDHETAQRAREAMARIDVYPGRKS